MSSWFSVNVESLKEMASSVNVESLADMASNVNVTDTLKAVQSALPKVDEGLIEKLTLTSPELAEERLQIDQEEREKEKLRNSLAGLLPWETRDPERDILVDECREAVLQLSHSKETFFGPYAMPTSKIVTTDDKDDADPALPPEAQDKLKKLEPLPLRLRDFNLDAHVGLIERLLKEDENLVEMQSKLSGGGARERVFWRNYFIHCAYTRYEAGLSIDEIWSDDPPVFDAAPAETADPVEDGEEAIVFQADEPAVAAPTPAASTPDTTSADFEMVKADEATDAVEEGAGAEELVDYELDELEAEIARELED